MNEQEYQDKLKVRTQLSLADQFRVLEHEFQMLRDDMKQLRETVKAEPEPPKET